MTIKIETRVEDGLGTTAKCIVCDSHSDWLLMKEFAHRAANLWPDAPPQLKRMADLITVGQVQQDYGPDMILSPEAQQQIERKFK